MRYTLLVHTIFSWLLIHERICKLLRGELICLFMSALLDAI